MSGLIICTMDHYAGDKYVRKGTIASAAAPHVSLYWEPFELDDGQPPPKKATRR